MCVRECDIMQSTETRQERERERDVDKFRDIVKLDRRIERHIYNEKNFLQNL